MAEQESGPTANLAIVLFCSIMPGGTWGETIQTGQRGSTEEGKIVTKSGSLGLLALGGVGLMAWRKQRGEVSAAH